MSRKQLRALDDLAPDTDDYERAAEFANECVRHGVAATTIDMLICAVGAGRGVPILTTDDDFAVRAVGANPVAPDDLIFGAMAYQVP